MKKRHICFRHFLSLCHFIVYDRATICAACASVGPLTIDVMSQQRQQEADLWPWCKSAVILCLITWAASASESHLSKTVSKQHGAPSREDEALGHWFTAESIQVEYLQIKQVNNDPLCCITLEVMEENEGTCVQRDGLLLPPYFNFKPSPVAMTIQPSAAWFLILQSPQTLLLLRFDCRCFTEPGGCFPQGVLSNKDIQPKDFEAVLQTSAQ